MMTDRDLPASDTVYVQETFASSTVLSTSGVSYQIREFWRDRPAVMVFLRHFG